MVTEPLPRKKSAQKPFVESDRMHAMALPANDALSTAAKRIETAMKAGAVGDVRLGCDAFLKTASEFYRVPVCSVRVLAARPLRVREHYTSELFGDYYRDTKLIRVWMRTAVQKKVTSFGTFLSTLCHEFCHHLDFHLFRFANSWHTRGFYQRAAQLYHHAKGTPVKELVWIPIARGRFRIDWQRTNRRAQPSA